MPRLIAPIEEHYPRRVSEIATTVMPKIKVKFQALDLSERTVNCPFKQSLDLSERATNCPFKQLFLVPDVKFFGVRIHQLLLRKVKSKEKNEMHFLIGQKVLRFGLLEFAMIT